MKLAAELQQVQSASHVYLFVPVGLADGGTHTHARGQMNDHLRTMDCHDLRKLRFIANIDGIKLVAANDICNKARSEEHTSELQSRFDLVCRLLLEKKKNKKRPININPNHLISQSITP